VGLSRRHFLKAITSIRCRDSKVRPASFRRPY
jgi:hypothetical protein